MTYNNHNPHIPRSIMILLGALVAFGPLSVDMYLPSLPLLAQDLHTSIKSVQQTITIFLLGFSLGMLVYGPLSDQFGRKKLLQIGMLIYIVATLGCALSQQIEQLQLFRLLQAIGGASASVLSRALVRDLYPNDEIPKVLSLMHIITMIATLIAPILGAWIATQLNWNAIFIFLLIYALLCSIWVKLSIPTPTQLHPPLGILKNYHKVLSNRWAWGFILCNSFSFAGMFAYITASAFIFIDYYGFTAQQYAYVFGFNIFSVIIFTSINRHLLKHYSAYQLLIVMTIIACSAGLYLAAITYFNLLSVWSLIVGLAVFVGITGSMGANSIANLLRILPQQAGTASGLAVASQFAMGSLMSFMVSLFFSNTHPAVMNLIICICGCLSLLSLMLTRGVRSVV